MKLGLLGSGAMGARHLAAAQGLPQFQLITRSTAPYDAIAHADRMALLAAMLRDPTIGALDICLPTSLHAPVAVAALAAGKHVLCEKPMALTLAECSRMIEAAQAADRVLMIAQVLRFFPAYRLLAHIARTQQFGPMLEARFVRESGIPDWAPWLAQPEESGGAILDLLVHDFDQALALCGRPSHITVTPIASPDAVHCRLDCADVPVIVEGGWFPDGRPFAMSFDVRFAQARLTFHAGANSDDLCMLERDGLPSRRLPLADVDPYREQLLYFAECCKHNTPPFESPPAESMAAVELALAARELALRNPGVPVPY